MYLGVFPVQDVHNLHAPRHHRVSDQLPVTPPRNGFCAHERHRVATSIGKDLLERGGKRGALHVVRVPAKRLAAPAGVERVRPRLPPSSQIFQVAVADAPIVKCGGEGLAGEVWMPPGRGRSPNIYEESNLIGCKQRQKFLEGTSGVANGKDPQGD